MSRPCLVWTGATNDKGYGQRRVDGRVQYVHRLAWEEEHGPIPDGMKVLHHCDNPPCYEVTHLFLGTTADNQADMAAKGRSTKGRFKDHCPRDHPYDETNTYVWKGRRYCRACRREADRRWREKR